MNVSNKIAIVTGSTKWIGRAIALLFASHSVKIVVCSRNISDCEDIAKEIVSSWGHAIPVQCDISQVSQVQEMIDVTLQNFGKIDILVNNAWVWSVKPFVEMNESDWDDIMNINLKGVFLCTNAVVKHMIPQKSWKIISIASILGKTGFLHASAYCTSKAWVINFTRSLAIELAPYNININAIAPWFITTEMTKGMLQDENIKNMLLSQIPANKIGNPEDIAKAALYLASDDAKYIHGETLTIDGGWLTH